MSGERRRTKANDCGTRKLVGADQAPATARRKNKSHSQGGNEKNIGTAVRRQGPDARYITGTAEQSGALFVENGTLELGHSISIAALVSRQRRILIR